MDKVLGKNSSYKKYSIKLKKGMLCNIQIFHHQNAHCNVSTIFCELLQDKTLGEQAMPNLS